MISVALRIDHTDSTDVGTVLPPVVSDYSENDVLRTPEKQIVALVVPNRQEATAPPEMTKSPGREVILARRLDAEHPGKNQIAGSGE